MLCSGIASPGCVAHVIGGIALVNVESMVATMTPMDVAVVDGKLGPFILPDERNPTLCIYEPT
ncbi:bfc5d6b2-de6e-4761-825d-be9714ad474a [Thermothielavioides terrestris]|uniref:Bfc5d6b2-de6e-4761-825d-be9714ad474a n=1 Tax=Thermothielavioides terrestris TaxID=2587410 RepID=A0A446BH69_9PEZI|nr:bfc5d6b2-de6e-4761-825d-be9714ad474a [Thermothielavioides terrestris]